MLCCFYLDEQVHEIIFHFNKMMQSLEVHAALHQLIHHMTLVSDEGRYLIPSLLPGHPRPLHASTAVDACCSCCSAFCRSV